MNRWLQHVGNGTRCLCGVDTHFGYHSLHTWTAWTCLRTRLPRTCHNISLTSSSVYVRLNTVKIFSTMADAVEDLSESSIFLFSCPALFERIEFTSYRSNLKWRAAVAIVRNIQVLISILWRQWRWADPRRFSISFVSHRVYPSTC